MKLDRAFFDGWEGLRSDYAAARETRFMRRRTGLPLRGSHADFHYRNEADFLKMLERSRDFDRNDQLIGQAIDRAVANEIQDGLTPDPATGDADIDADLSARWKAEAEDPEAFDLAGEMTFGDIEGLVNRHIKVDGDILVLPNAETETLETIEAHRLRTPRGKRTNTDLRNIVHGVELDPGTRTRLGYWITKDEINPWRSAPPQDAFVRIAARDQAGRRQAFHVKLSKRITQTRGVTLLKGCFDTSGMFEDISFAKLVQAQVVSSFAIFRQRELQFEGGTPEATGAQTTETQADGTSRLLEGIGPAMEIRGEPGETLQGFSPGVPNPEFFPHADLMLAIMAVNLGLPPIMMLLDATKTNFSAWRGAMDQAKITFRRNQKNLVSHFHRPVYGWKVERWSAGDAALRRASGRTDIDIFRHKWQLPSWPYVEPLKDANADRVQVSNNLNSLRRIHAARGRDWDEVAPEIVADKARLIGLAIEAAKELNVASPNAQVGWRDIIDFSKGGQSSAAAGTSERSEPAGPRSFRRAV